VTLALSLQICRDSCILPHTPTLALPLQIPSMLSHLLYMLPPSLSLSLDKEVTDADTATVTDAHTTRAHTHKLPVRYPA
jgi:hypothetical protein